MNKPKTEEIEEITPMEEIIPEDFASLVKDDKFEEEIIEDLIPQMNINVPSQLPEVPELISDPEYLGLLDEIKTNIRDDRKQVSEYIDNLADMVINDGDASKESKEALVNMMKIKTDLQDKMLKIADLMTRIKVKNTYAHSGAHLNALQQNNFISDGFDRKELIRNINHDRKKKKDNK